MVDSKWSIKKRKNAEEIVSTLRSLADQIEVDREIIF